MADTLDGVIIPDALLRNPRMVYVYGAVNNENGKAYFGLTNNLPRRMREHRKAALAGSPTAFHRAIRKYGWGSFEWGIFFECNSVNGASECEQRLIRRFGSYGCGYNMTTGGEARWTKKTKESTKKKLAALYLGKTYEDLHGREKAEAIKAKQSAFHKGKKVTKETRERMSESNRRRWASGAPIGKKGKPCEVAGVKYPNLISAARAHNVAKESVKYWIRRGQHGARLL